MPSCQKFVDKAGIKYPIETGTFPNGCAFGKVGAQPDILVIVEGLNDRYQPPQGTRLQQFIEFATPFLEHFTIYTINRKSRMPTGYLMDRMAADYVEIFRDIFHRPVSVLGISTGGQICHYIAADYPEWIKNVIIVSAAYRLSPSGAVKERSTARKIHRKIKKKQFLRRFFPNYGQDRDLEKCLVEIEADLEMNFKDRLSEIETPTLILSGEDDPYYIREDVKITAAGIPNSQLQLYEGQGHGLRHSKRIEITATILEFLSPRKTKEK